MRPNDGGPDLQFETDHLDIDCSLPTDIEDSTFPDLYVGLDVGLLAPGDGIVTDRHHASADRYEADDAMNQIGGVISPFTLSGWLRHGCEAVLHAAGSTACHPGEANGDYMLDEVYERDLEAGYHEKGTCVGSEEHGEDGCLIYQLFGGFGDRAGRVIRRPLGFSPIRRQVDVRKGEAEAHYRQLATHVRSRNDADDGQPLRYAQRDVVGNLVGTWRLTLRELRPEYVGLLTAAVSLLHARNDEYAFQLGGARNFGGGITDASIVNPLYSKRQLKRLYNRAQAKTTDMETKDELWRDSCRDMFLRATQEQMASDDTDIDTSSLEAAIDHQDGEGR